jgi:hypothetical protein
MNLFILGVLGIVFAQMEPGSDYECSQENIDQALNEYPGGQCQFVLDQDDCAPGSNFNFLSMYFCKFNDWFGHNGK